MRLFIRQKPWDNSRADCHVLLFNLNVTGVALPHSRINTTKDWLVPLLIAPNNIDTIKRLLLPPQ
ncbi:hypothetical protein ACTFWZ_02090 [Enterococcus gallinarum]|uniref:hypothetical protein n=1 Tax=Enterococcus gallinarum TaxID=1353 RepID=UPI003F76E6DB